MNLLKLFAYALRKQKVLKEVFRVVGQTHYIFTLMEVMMDTETLTVVEENGLRGELPAIIVCRLCVTGIKAISFSVQTTLPGFERFAEVTSESSDWRIRKDLQRFLVHEYGFKQFKGMEDMEILGRLLCTLERIPELFK